MKHIIQWISLGMNLLLLWGCAGNSPERQSQLCGHLTGLDGAAVKLRRVQASAAAAVTTWNQTAWNQTAWNQTEVQQADQEADNAFTAVKQAAGQDLNLGELETAYGELDQSVQQMSQQLNDPATDPSTKAQLIAALPEKIDALESASRQLKERLSCP